jgi:hypothetical protein
MSVQSIDPLGSTVGKNVVKSGNGTVLVDETGGGKVMRFVNEGGRLVDGDTGFYCGFGFGSKSRS